MPSKLSGAPEFKIDPALHERVMHEVANLDRMRVCRVLWQRWRYRVAIDGGGFFAHLFWQLLTVPEPIGVWTAKAIEHGLMAMPNQGRGTPEGAVLGAVQCANMAAVGSTAACLAQLMWLIEGDVYMEASLDGLQDGAEPEVLFWRWLGYLQRVRCQDAARWWEDQMEGLVLEAEAQVTEVPS